VRISAPYKLVSSREGHRRSTIRVGPTSIGGSAFAPHRRALRGGDAGAGRRGLRGGGQGGRHHPAGDVYKHRTSPYAFQGLGAAGLEILAEQKARFGLPVVAEVLHPRKSTPWSTWSTSSASCPQHAELRPAPGLLADRQGRHAEAGLSATIEEWLLAAE